MAAALTIRWARSPQARAGLGALTSKKINTQTKCSRPRIDLSAAAALRELPNMSLTFPQKPPEESQSLFHSAWEQHAVTWGTRSGLPLRRPHLPLRATLSQGERGWGGGG